MFKGYSEEFKQKLEKRNQNSENFCFCVYDLQSSSDRQVGEYKFDIVSSELRQKLGSVITSNGGTMSSPRGIKFPSLPTNLAHYGTKSRHMWIKIDKGKLAELANASKGRIIEFPAEETRWKFHVLTATRLACELKVSDQNNYGSIINWVANEDRKIYNAGYSAIKKIKERFQKTGVSVSQLETSYFIIFPDWCSCEFKGDNSSENYNLWESHINSCLWREESEINDFKDKMLGIIDEKFTEYKNQVIQEIIGKARARKVEESELEKKQTQWKDELLTKEKKEWVDDFKKVMEHWIALLAPANSGDTNQTTTNQTEQGGNNTNEPNQTTNGTNPNNQTQTTNQEQTRQRNEQVAQEVNDNLSRATNPNATIQEKKDALSKLEEHEGEESYEKKKEETKQVKVEVAKDNPNEYHDKVVSNLDKKLIANRLKKEDLDNQTQQEIKELSEKKDWEPEKLVEKETELMVKVSKAGAKKKVDNIAVRVEKVLQEKDKNKVIATILILKEQLLEIINSSNVYYSEYKSRAERLLKQLNEVSQSNSIDNGLSLPIKIMIGGGIAVVIVFASVLILKMSKKKKKKQ